MEFKFKSDRFRNFFSQIQNPTDINACFVTFKLELPFGPIQCLDYMD